MDDAADTNGGGTQRPACVMCVVSDPLGEAEARAAVAATPAVLDSYWCPRGQGWHLRIRKTTVPD